MAETLEACCEKARRDFIARLRRGVTSYPVIKEFPCPQCKRIVKVRMYTSPDEASEGA